MKKNSISTATSLLLTGIYSVIASVATMAWAPFIWWVSVMMLIVGIGAVITAYSNAKTNVRRVYMPNHKVDKLRHICAVEEYYTAQFSDGA